MADLALAAAQTLFAALGCSQLQGILSITGYKSQLEELKQTVSTIQNVLLDASNQHELSNQAQDYIEKLKDAVYDADDLFDELLTLSTINKLDSKPTKVTKKVQRFFTSENSLVVAYKTSNEVKKIKKVLDDIARNHSKFSFNFDSRLKFDSKHIKNRREETCSYVYAPNVIGRESDTKAVIDMFLNNNDTENVGFVTIVGVGGLGKTTLAQLVCNDERIKLEFPTRGKDYPLSRIWVCVSDQDGVKFDVSTILSKVIKVAKPDISFDESNMEIVRNKFQEILGGQKCLIVLDDLWNEQRLVWVYLRDMLMRLGRGSRVMVTTRSNECARVVGDDDSHRTFQLGGLSKENSWQLFKVTAFGHQTENEDLLDQELVKIGREIVEQQCFGLPLAVKVVGTLLFGQHKREWEAFQKVGLSKRDEAEKQILRTLKFSYYNLEPSLRSCFAYCACFPKDYEIQKELLIRIWMAQGYLVPVNKAQSIEYIGNEYFMILLRRCFFQDVKTDIFGDVHSLKMHDLMHDVALEVKGKEVCVSQSNDDILGNKIRHLCFLGDESIERSFSELKLRSCLQFSNRACSYVDISIANGKHLRILSLAGVGIESLPDSIGKLRQLRYLDLSGNDKLKQLPATVGQLYNLQTLNLQGCTQNMKELPENLGQLVNLRYLNVDGYWFSHMPPGMDKLIELRVLTCFIVNNVDARVGQLKDLRALKHLTGSLDIVVKDFPRGNDDGDQGYLSSIEHLNELCVTFSCDYSTAHSQEEVMGKMQPHSNLKKFKLHSYFGSTIPKWGRPQDNWAAALLPCLAEITLYKCVWLQNLPQLSGLPLLKFLEIDGGYMEYMEETAGITFFPSLRSLKLWGLGNLKGWWRSVPDDKEHPAFPLLSHLGISLGYSLCTFPPCTFSLETLWIGKCNEALQIRIVGDETNNGASSSASFSQHHDVANLRRVDTDRMVYLSELPLASVTDFTMRNHSLKSLSEKDIEVLKGCSSLQSLNTYYIPDLGILQGLKHVTTLVSLSIIKWTPDLRLQVDEMRWRTTLKNLKLCDVGAEGLPEWIGHLSSLTYFKMTNCYKITKLPESIQNLTSLQQLQITRCSEVLKERCQEPDGEDWHKIQHIPHIDFSSDW